MQMRAGFHLGFYEIVASIGAGGMGEIYEARDAKLGRTVALKILPAELADDPDRLRRFTQEARSASGLSHPNIVTIHDIDEAIPVANDGEAAAADSKPVHYIAMELVDGSTLRTLFKDPSRETRALIEYLAQAADGLAKAHAAGIVHRDLKPENIMVTRDGYAKVLDFGLAKLTEDPAGETAFLTEPLETQPARTQEGAVMGTVGYMSPEQALGKAVDHRTDLFAFGCILYEAATRQKPFQGESSVDVLHAIMREEPTPVEELAPQTPRVLVRTIRRCLAKDPNRRHHSMKDLALELHEMVDEWDELALPSGPVSTGSGLSQPDAGVRRGPKSKVVWPGIVAGSVVVLAVAVALWHRYEGGQTETTPGSVAKIQMTALTSTGDVVGAAISPDGKYVAYIRAMPGGMALWLRQIASGGDVQIATGDGIHTGLYNPVFTPDGSFIDYESDSGGGEGILYQVPVLGGSRRRLIDGIDTPPTYSPDGKRIAFVRQDLTRHSHSLIVANADGANEIVLDARDYKEGEFFLPYREGKHFWAERQSGGPAWSPDGETIAVSGGEGGVLDSEIVLVSVGDGTEEILNKLPCIDISGLAWLPGGRSLVVSAVSRRESGHRSPQLWRVETSDGSVTRLTNDLNQYIGVGLSVDGRELVTIQSSKAADLWSAPLAGVREPREFSSAGTALYGRVEASADGTIIYTLESQGAHQIWKRRNDGSTALLVRCPELCGLPQVSRDGNRILFVSLAADGKTRIFRMDADGADQRVISKTRGLNDYSLSPDGTWFAYQDNFEIWRRAVDGGSATPLAEDPKASLFSPRISPDGERVAYERLYNSPDGGHLSFAIVSARTGKAVGNVALPPGQDIRMWRWAPDERALLLLLRNPASDNFFRLPIDGSPETQLTHFNSTRIRTSFALIDDGKAVVFPKLKETNDAVLIQGFG